MDPYSQFGGLGGPRGFGGEGMGGRGYYERLIRQVNDALLREDGPMKQYHERIRRDGQRSEVEQSILDKIDEIQELERGFMHGVDGIGGQFRYPGGPGGFDGGEFGRGCFGGGDFGRGEMLMGDGSRLQRVIEMIEQMRAHDDVGRGGFGRGGMGRGRPFG